MMESVGDEVAEDKGVYEAFQSGLHQRRRVEMTAVYYRILEAIYEVGYTRSHQPVQR